MSPIPPTLADRLYALRRQRGWSQRKLAARAQISNATVSRIESGTGHGVSLTIVTMLADALGCEVSALLLGGPPTRQAIDDLAHRVYRSLLPLTAPHRAAAPYPQLAADLAALRTARVACDFVQVLAVAPPVLRALSVQDRPDDTTHACYDVALALRMLGHLSTAFIALNIAQQAADLAVATAALSPVVTALRGIFAIEDEEPATALALVEHARPAPVDGPAAAAGHATLAIVEGLTHAHTRRSDGSDQVHRARRLLARSDGTADLLGTGIFRPSDLDLWHMKIAVARRDFHGARALAGTPPPEPFTALLWQLNMCTVSLRLNEVDQAAGALLAARDLAPQLLPGRPETAGSADTLLTKRLKPRVLLQLRAIREDASAFAAR
ncbi:helix-turn-helix transcriptional regulator [Longispora sp. NPDC051575]|uniref:helix-turn-helix transcriptional regulator n=1 Tax=Longispora sp. NPDC051575 TaxID=3154943 RepID=UPI00343D9520